MGAMVNDPLGDMIARIRNAAMRKRDKVATPGVQAARPRAGGSPGRGYIRGFTLIEEPGEHPTYEIELKYFDNEP
jgi:small subunit ribosomal protein S8